MPLLLRWKQEVPLSVRRGRCEYILYKDIKNVYIQRIIKPCGENLMLNSLVKLRLCRLKIKIEVLERLFARERSFESLHFAVSS